MKVLGIAGSLRADSFNKTILANATDILKEIDASIKYSNLDLKTLALPVYDKDIETAGIPESVFTLKHAITESDILLISTPENNHSIPGGLKNAIDWASRGDKNPFAQKIVAIIGATDGLGGTLRAQEHLRITLAALNAYAIPYPEVAIRNVDEKIDTDGRFTDEKGREQIRKLLERTVKIAERLRQ